MAYIGNAGILEIKLLLKNRNVHNLYIAGILHPSVRLKLGVSL